MLLLNINMLIRKEQMDVFEVSAVEGFARKVLPELKSSWPSRCLYWTDDTLLENIKSSIVEARSYKIHGDSYLTEYLHMATMHGFDFPNKEDHAWALIILNDDELTVAEKIESLQHAIITARETSKQ